MRSAGDLNRLEGILFAVCPLACFSRFDGRRYQKLVAAGIVGKDDWAIILWVYLFFHDFIRLTYEEIKSKCFHICDVQNTSLLFYQNFIVFLSRIQLFFISNLYTSFTMTTVYPCGGTLAGDRPLTSLIWGFGFPRLQTCRMSDMFRKTEKAEYMERSEASTIRSLY